MLVDSQFPPLDHRDLFGRKSSVSSSTFPQQNNSQFLKPTLAITGCHILDRPSCLGSSPSIASARKKIHWLSFLYGCWSFETLSNREIFNILAVQPGFESHGFIHRCRFLHRAPAALAPFTDASLLIAVLDASRRQVLKCSSDKITITAMAIIPRSRSRSFLPSM